MISKLTQYSIIIEMALKGIGKAFKISAENSNISNAEKISNLQQAKNWYQKSLEIYSLYQDKVIVPQIAGTEMVEPDKNARSECDKQLK